MKMGMMAALVLGLAAPAFAQSDTAKDVDKGIKDTVDKGKDSLHTDSGTAKAKRHAAREGRNAKKKARDAKNKVKDNL
jgi:hypothetical protein